MKNKELNRNLHKKHYEITRVTKTCIYLFISYK